MSLDFKRFFYSVDVTEEFMETLLEKAAIDYSPEDRVYAKRTNDFVMDVNHAYQLKISRYICLVLFGKGNVVALQEFFRRLWNGRSSKKC